MLINPLTLLGLSTGILGSAADAVTGAVSSLTGLAGDAGQDISSEFTNLLNGGNGLTLTSQESLSFDPEKVAANLNGQNLPAAANPLEQKTLSYIEQILNAKPSTEGQNLTSAQNTTSTDSNLTESQSEIFSKIQKFLDDNKDSISQANDDEIKGLVDLIGKIVAAAQPTTAAASNNSISQTANKDAVIKDFAQQSQTPQLLEAKQDPRLLGKDNVESMISSSENANTKTAAGLLDNKKSLFDSNSSLKMLSGDDNPNLNMNQFDKLTADTKAAQQQNAAPIVRYTSVEPGNYSIARVTKQNGKIEIVLEPANLGKVDIKMDFGTDGKTNMVVTAERKETLDLLQKDAKYFEKILADSGIKADSGSLSFNLRHQGSGAESFAGQYSDQQNRGFMNHYNFIVPANDSNQAEVKNFSNLSAYQNVQSVNGLNILV